MQTIISIKNHFQFTEEHLELVKKLLPMESFPQFYTNQVFTSLKVLGISLIPEDLIIRDGVGSSQSVRLEGLNPRYADLKVDINENGWKLTDKPIFVTRTGKGGKYNFIDGRTKDKILHEKKVKNRICVVVEIDPSEEEDYALCLNSGIDRSPAGLIREVDLISSANRKLDSGALDLDAEQIRKWIDKICQSGKFSRKKRSDLSFQIFHHYTAIQTNNLLPVAWANTEEVLSWMKLTNYVETPSVVYVPYAASSSKKALVGAARLSQQNPGKEIRILVYVSNLNGYNLKNCYIKALLKFKKEWFDHLDLLSNTYYNGSKPLADRVKLYGYVPSNIEGVCENMDKAIVIGKTDQYICDSMLTISKSSTVYDINEDEYGDD